MKEDLLKLVKENLPALAAETLVQTLEEGKKNKVLVEELEARLKLSEKQKAETYALLEEEQKKNAAWLVLKESLVEREKNVIDIEHKNALTEMAKDCAMTTLNEVKQVVAMVFKNTNIRKRVTGTEPVAVEGSNNCGGFVSQGHRDQTTETTEE